MKHKLLNKLLTLTLLILGGAILSPAWADDPITLFHETFGNNSGSARAWSDSYSVKSGISDVYSGITSYTVSNVKQGKNSTGSTLSGLNQSSAGTDAYIIIGPLNVASYNMLSLTYQWKAASTKGTYTTKAYYATSSSGSYTEVSGTGTGTASSFVERSYSLPAAAQVSTLYLKIVWNTSNTQGIIDEVNLSGVAAPVTHTLTYSASNGSIAGVDAESSTVASGDDIAEGATVTLTATPSSGYEFSSWSVSGTGSTLSSTTDNPTTFTMGTANSTVTANFVASVTSDYIIVSPTTKNITSSAGDVEFTISTDQTLDEDPIRFYTTADGDVTTKPAWITEVLYDEGTLFLTVAENAGAARTAYFKVENGSVKSDVITINQAAKTYEIEQYTAPVTAHGTITFSPESPIATGAEVTLTATPAEGYAFTADSWTFYKESGDDFIEDNSITVTNGKITMPSYNLYVDATFDAIAVTGVTLNKNSASLGVGDTETLTATVAPSNALNKAVTWTSSNTSVATVSNGTVTAVAAGSATITVTTTDGSFTATCTVTVVSAVTFDATKDTGTSLSKDGVTFATSATESSVYKWYKSSSTTFAVTNGKIKRIEFTGVSGYAISNMTASAGTLNTSDSPNGVWTGSVASVTFTASTAQARASKVKVFVATTATPTFSLAGGEYEEAKEVSISCATDGATIYYTTDGSTPTSSSTEYTGAIDITETTTLKAIAIYDGVSSSVASATYTMNRPAAPTFDVATCVFDEAFDLHLSTETDGATIYYTTDGSTPSTSSSVYSEEIAISTETTTVKAIAVKDGLTSDVASATYTYDSRITPTFSLSTTSLGLKVNDTSDAVTLTTNSDGDVTFSCADSHVTLTGTGNSRTISANAAGTYTVNVTITNSGDYKDAAGTITVTVTKKATMMVIATAFDDGKDLYTASEGLIEGAVKYNDVALNPQPTITYTSGTPSVATVDEDGVITFVKAGSTTITVAFEGNDEYEASNNSYALDLIDTTPQETSIAVSTNHEWLGVTSGSNISASDCPKEIDCSNVTATIDGSVTYPRGDDTYIRMYNYSTLKLDAPSGYYITHVTFTKSTESKSKWDAEPTANAGTYTSSTKSWEGNTSSVTFTFNGTVWISNITIALAESVIVTSAGYTTYVAKHDISFPAGLTAYISTTKTDETLKLTEKASVPEGTAIILKGDAGTYALPTITTTPADVTGNLLQASDGTVTGNGSTIYALAKKNDVVGFYLVNDGVTVPAGKAYLIVNANVKGFTFVFEDDEDAINEVNGSGVKANGSVYDLQGRRVLNPGKGLYIVNGKKIMK